MHACATYTKRRGFCTLVLFIIQCIKYTGIHCLLYTYIICTLPCIFAFLLIAHTVHVHCTCTYNYVYMIGSYRGLWYRKWYHNSPASWNLTRCQAIHHQTSHRCLSGIQRCQSGVCACVCVFVCVIVHIHDYCTCMCVHTCIVMYMYCISDMG